MVDHIVRRAMLQVLAVRMRTVASRVGPLHSYWDIIADIQEIIKNNKEVDDETFNGYWLYYDEE